MALKIDARTSAGVEPGRSRRWMRDVEVSEGREVGSRVRVREGR